MRSQEMASPGSTVNVTVTRQRKMLVQAWVNGSRGNFLVDTGAGNSYMGGEICGQPAHAEGAGGIFL